MARILRGSVPQLVLTRSVPDAFQATAINAGTTSAAITGSQVLIPGTGARIIKWWWRSQTIGSSSAGNTVQFVPIKRGATSSAALADASTAALVTVAVPYTDTPVVNSGSTSITDAGCTEGDVIDFWATFSTTSTTGPLGLTFSVLWQL